jgi:hypothetical protein
MISPAANAWLFIPCVIIPSAQSSPTCKWPGDAFAHPRAVDTLGRMLRRGSITVEMAKAGPQFCSEFSRAYLDPLQAADIGRVPVSGRRIHECSYHIQSARERAWAALEAVGGLASPGGCCIWSVVGGERKLKEWALQQGWNGRRISEESASRILISALGSLAGSYDA